MPEVSPFVEIAVILSLATIVGIIGQKLRQPLIIMFLATGILAGPSFLGIITSYEQIELLAHFGIALLLFIVGLKLDIKLIRSTGPVALATGLGQIIFTSLIGFIIAVLLGITYLTAAYIAVALTFSSTIIIVKLLSDKKEIDSLHGQIAIGFLIVQDIAAILALIALTTFGSSIDKDDSIIASTVLIISKGAGLFGIVALMMKFVLPKLTEKLAHSLELLTLFAISWAVFLGAGSELLGFSKEVGAFIAGVSLASTNFRDSIGARLTGLRDFLLLFFFIDLGSRLDWSTVGSQIGNSIIFSAFVLIGNPIIVLIIMGFMGYRRRTGFLAGLTVAQISEFSLIVSALGLSIGHITNETMGLITLVGVITIFISTYLILYSIPIYNKLSGVLKIFERRTPYREADISSQDEAAPTDVILAGLGNYGSGLAEYLIRRKKSVLGMDFDPVVLDKWRKKGLPVIYGDMADPDIQEYLPLHKTKWVISTVRSKELNLALIYNLRKESYEGKIALTATNEEEAREFEKSGVDLILRPFIDATELAADALTYSMDYLPEKINWPVSFLEVRIQADSATAGHTIRNSALTFLPGVSILSVSRGGKIFYDPVPDFIIKPADRLLIIGPPGLLKDAERLINQPDAQNEKSDKDRFEVAELQISDYSILSGRTVAETGFRQKYNVTLIGIKRNRQQITEVGPSTRLESGDYLIIIGKSDSVKKIKHNEPL